MPFVVFEGGEGTGKSTQINLLAHLLMESRIPYVVTREPGGTPLAEDIRALFKTVSTHGDNPLPLTELLLVMAARAQHINCVIAPALEQKKIVICDRFFDSSLVYQGIRGGIPIPIINAIAAPILGQLLPQVTFVFTLPVDVGLSRTSKRAQHTLDRLDNESRAVHQIIHQGFEDLVNNHIPWPSGAIPKRIIIDATQNIEVIFSQIKKHLQLEIGVCL